MNKIVIASFVLSVLAAGCKDTGSAGKDRKVVNEDTLHYFQTSYFFQKDIKDVTETPYYIYKTEIVNGKKDSVQIDARTFNELARKFTSPDITDKALKPLYKESIFEDQTTQGYTINYTAKDRTLEIQNVDILMKEDGKTVKDIFIRKFFNYPDSSAIEQLSWKPGHRFQIVRSVMGTDNKEKRYQTNVVWREKD